MFIGATAIKTVVAPYKIIFTMLDKSTILWLVSFAFANGGALIGIYIRLNSRIVAIETLLRAQSEKFMRGLHSPNNHHGLDPLLDKYIDNLGELTFEEWRSLHDKCEGILFSVDVSKGEKALAAWVSAFAEHKLKCGKKAI